MVKYSQDMTVILERIARKEGIPVSEVVQEMEIAIDAAKNSKDQKASAAFHRLFGNKTPSLEEFVHTLARLAGSSGS